MTDQQNIVRLRVNGLDYGGWKKVSISAGIERQARNFSLAVTDRWPGAMGQGSIPHRIRPGDLCELYIGADKVLTGFVDATPISYDALQFSVGVTGRSKTADLVDCSAINTPGQWRGMKIERVAAELAQPYGVTVRAEVDTGAAVPDHQIQQGETVAESLDRILRIRHLLATDTAEGELVLITVGGARADTALVLGGDKGNILSADVPFDFKDRFSAYVCKGQRAGDDASSAETVSGGTASNTDTAITRKRVMLIKQTGQADEGTCRDRVDYERSVRMGKSLAATYIVAGWRQGSGALWAPNLLVRVQDRIAGFDRDMLISEVEYKLDEGGLLAVLQVAPPEAFATAAWKQRKTKGAKAKKDVDEVSGVDEWVNYTKGIQ